MITVTAQQKGLEKSFEMDSNPWARPCKIVAVLHQLSYYANWEMLILWGRSIVPLEGE